MSRVDLKIVLLGHEAVGKTSLMQRYVNDKFNESSAYQNTIGSAFASKEVEVDEKKLVLGIWDTAGSERFEAMTKIYYRGAAAAIVCYDITKPETISKAKFWIKELRSVEENCSIYLCAAKLDLLNKVEQDNLDLDVIKKYASGMQAKFFVTSSKDGCNVEMFQEIAKDYLVKQPTAKNVDNFITLYEEPKRFLHCYC